MKKLFLFSLQLVKLIIPISLFLLFDFLSVLKAQAPIDCGFLVTKVHCLETGDLEVCVEAIEENYQHAWTVTIPGNPNPITNSNWKWCFVVQAINNTIFTITHEISDPIGGRPGSVCTKNITKICPSGDNLCNILNPRFVGFDANCNAILRIDNSTGLNYNWSFGDGTKSIQSTASDVLHSYAPRAGNFEVCITTNNSQISTFITSCCITLFIPACCEQQSINWSSCNVGTECCYLFTFNSKYSSTSYTWSFGDGTPDEVTTGKTVVHYYKGEGPYQICVNYTVDGIPFQCCEFINPPCYCCEDADFTFSPTFPQPNGYQSCMNNYFSVDPICDRDGITVHKWYFSDGNYFEGSYPNSIPPPHIFTNWISDGNICIEHEIYCNNELIDVEEKCLPFFPGVYLGIAGTEIKMSDFLSNIGYTVKDYLTDFSNIPGRPVYIDGTLVVDVDCSFSGGTWNMGKFGKIVIKNGVTFGLNEMTIQTAFRVNLDFACCRWDGIEAEPDCRLNWNLTTISDAKTMLNCINTATTNGARLNFTNNIFKENINGINAIDHKFKFLLFHNNTFSGCEDCLLTCGCGEGTGIFVDLSGINTIPMTFPITGPKNTIKEFMVGVHGINLSLTLKNFEIKDIENEGLWFVKSNNRSYNLTIDKLNFDNMKTAIFEDISGDGTHKLFAQASVPQSSLTISEVIKGYDININKTFFDGLIKHNLINTNGGMTNFGIQTSLIGTNDNIFNASNNTINSGVGGGASECLGISLVSDLDENQNGVISFNTVNIAGLETGAGINVNNWQNTKVTDNTVNINGLLKPGIEFSNSGRSLISCNGINGGSKGMSFSISQGNDIFINVCNGNRNGIYYEGDCNGVLGTFMGRNSFSNSTAEGSLYNINANTGTQAHNEFNIWLPVVIGVVKARHQNLPLALACQVSHPTGALNPSINFPVRFQLPLFGSPLSHNNTTPLCSFSGGGFGGFHTNSSSSGQNYNNLIIESGLYDDMSLPLQTSMKQSIFELVLENQDWITNYINLGSFYFTNLNNFIGQSTLVRNALKGFKNILETQRANLQPLYDQISNLEIQLTNLYEQLDIAIDPAIISGIQAQIGTIQAQIASINQSITTQIATNNNSNLITINNLQAANNNLVVTSIHEDYEKTVNNLLIKLWNSEELTTSDVSILRVIAQNCYQDGGRSVFDARSLCLSQLNEYYSQDYCLDQFENYGINSRIGTSTNFGLKISPNPVTEDLLLEVTNSKETSDLNILFKVVDGLGREVNPLITKVGLNRYRMNFKSINNGIYFINSENKGIKMVSKVIVNH